MTYHKTQGVTICCNNCLPGTYVESSQYVSPDDPFSGDAEGGRETSANTNAG